jgi:hypothetical protein
MKAFSRILLAAILFGTSFVLGYLAWHQPWSRGDEPPPLTGIGAVILFIGGAVALSGAGEEE